MKKKKVRESIILLYVTYTSWRAWIDTKEQEGHIKGMFSDHFELIYLYNKNTGDEECWFWILWRTLIPKNLVAQSMSVETNLLLSGITFFLAPMRKGRY